MKLFGYINLPLTNTFTFPVFVDENGCLFHQMVDKNFNILEYEISSFDEDVIKKVESNREFDIGTKGAIAFICEDNTIIIGEVTLVLNEIINYLSLDKMKDYLFTKKEALNLQKVVFKNTIRKIESEFGSEGLESSVVIFIGETLTSLYCFKANQIKKKEVVVGGKNAIINQLQHKLNISLQAAEAFYQTNYGIKKLSRRINKKTSRKNSRVLLSLRAKSVMSETVIELITPIIENSILQDESYKYGLLLTGNGIEVRQSSKLIASFSDNNFIKLPASKQQIVFSRGKVSSLPFVYPFKRFQSKGKLIRKAIDRRRKDL